MTDTNKTCLLYTSMCIRDRYETVSDEEAMEAFFKLSRYEGIIPAIESSHAVAYAMRRAKEMRQGSILVCFCLLYTSFNQPDKREAYFEGLDFS